MTYEEQGAGGPRAAAVKQPIGRLGGAFMIGPEMRTAVAELQAGGWGTYMIGRCGVLGDVHASVVEATLWFFPRERVEQAWARARAVVTPVDGAARFARACHEWAANHLTGVPDLDRLGALLETVAAHADVGGAPLFAGWRAMPLPDDPAARVVQLCHVLREHRGALHGLAVAACGLRPLEAVVAGEGGEANARFFGWPDPLPAVTDEMRQRRAAAEALTDALVEPAWAVLADEEFAECAQGLTAAQQHAFAQQ